MVGPFQGPVEGEMLLDDARPQDIGGNDHGDPVVMGGEPDDVAGESLAKCSDHLQVQLLELAGIASGALEHGKVELMGTMWS